MVTLLATVILIYIGLRVLVEVSCILIEGASMPDVKDWKPRVETTHFETKPISKWIALAVVLTIIATMISYSVLYG